MGVWDAVSEHVNRVTRRTRPEEAAAPTRKSCVVFDLVINRYFVVISAKTAFILTGHISF